MTPTSTPLARIARLSAAFLGSNLARAAIGFGVSFALARGLGAERFGRWIFCTAWASTLTVVVDLGFGVLLTRDGARAEAEPGRLLSGALVLRLAVVLPLAALLYAGAGRLSPDAETSAGLRVAALLGGAGAMYGCFGALFRSQPRWLPAVLAVETGWLLVQLIATLVIVGTGAGWAGAAGWAGWAGGAGGAGGAGWAGPAGWAGSELVSLMALALVIQLAQIGTAAVCWTAVFGERGRMHRPSRDTLATLLRRALPFAASGIVANVQTRVGPLMLGYLSTPSELGLFAAASRLGSVARLAPQAAFAGALPVLAHEHGRDRASAERVFHALEKVLLVAAAAAAMGCALFAAPLLRLVYGPAFTAASRSLMWVSVGLIPLLSNSGRKVFLYASGREALAVRWSAFALLGQLCAGVVLIPMLGSTGAAISVGAGEAITWWPLRRTGPQHLEHPEPPQPPGHLQQLQNDFPATSS